jgi:hypothetical protein
MIASFIEWLIGFLTEVWEDTKALFKWYFQFLHNGGIFYLLFGPRGVAVIKATVTNAINAFIQATPGLMSTLANDLQPLASQVEAAVTTVGGGIRTALEPGLASIGTQAFNTIAESLAGNTDVTPAQWETIAGKLFGDAAGFGLSSFAVSAAFESIFPEKLNTLNSVGPLLATLAGFEEVTHAGIGPMLYAYVAQPARYDANSKARSLLPDLMTARIMLSRRLITQDQFNTLVAYAGLSPDWVAADTALSYRPIQARALATAIADTPFPTSTMTAVLQDNGFSDANVNFMLSVLQYNSTKNVRNSYISEALTAYGDGVVSDTELNQILTSQGWSDDAVTMATNRALIMRRVKLATEVSSQVVSEVAAGLLTAEQGLQALEAAGVVDWQAQLKITLATTKAELQAARKAASAEAKLELTRQRNLTRAAVAEFERGAINAEALTAALAVLGLDPTLIASVVAVETAKQAGKLKFVYGQFLTPQNAKVLTEKVAAYEAQFKAAQIDLATVTNALASLNIPDAQAKALIADWAASKPVTTTVTTKQPV